MTMILDPRVAAAVASAIGSIPGCSMNMRGVLDLKQRTGGWGALVTVDGWSPSLHGLHMQWTLVIGPSLDVEDQTASALSSIATLLQTQRDRAAAALALPCRPSAFPLDQGGNRYAYMHLDVDASALAVIIGDDDHRYTRSPPHTPEQAARHRESVLDTPALDRMGDLGTYVSDLHRGTTDHDGGPSLRWRDVTVSERRGRRVLDWVQLVRTPGHKGPSGQGMLRGTTLTLDPVAIPETLADLLPGRPLRDLVDIHPMLSDRIIRRLRTLTNGRVSVTLAPAQVSIDDVRTMDVRQALVHLTDVIRGGQAGDADLDIAA
jgi:hypothetical protein